MQLKCNLLLTKGGLLSDVIGITASADPVETLLSNSWLSVMKCASAVSLTMFQPEELPFKSDDPETLEQSCVSCAFCRGSQNEMRIHQVSIKADWFTCQTTLHYE